MHQPRERSRLRLAAGRLYYTAARYVRWYLSRIRWADEYAEPLRCVAFEHRTPLIRDLPGHKMWMQHNKITNLKLAAAELSSLLIRPGERFSFWQSVGRPSAARGYMEGMVLSGGEIDSGVGGGLCQMSNLIYWMTLHTPLTVVERYRHSYDVFPDSGRTQPFGSGATCCYPYIDLEVENRTGQDYQLVVWVSDEHLVGQWRAECEPDRSYEVYEKKHWITHHSWGGYVRHNIIHRRVLDRQDNLIDDEYVTENHAIMMYEPLLQSGDESSPPDSKGQP